MLALLALIAPSSAADFDPELTWRTITTDHFQITFHQGEEQVADEFAQTVEDVYGRMTTEVRWVPKRKTEIVLVDRTDQSNGYAMTVPWNTIVIYVTAPQEDSSLGFYEDWSETVVTHEFTHILHLDSHHGLVSVARAVVGRVASTNQLSPLWMIEGFATFEETRNTTGGRGRAPIVDMVKRTAMLEDDWPPLGNLDGLQADPPAGNLRYLFGDDFIQYVADHTGRDVWTKWVHRYGSGIPYLLPSKAVFGERLVPLYRDWTEDARARYGAVKDAVDAEGVREGRLVSDGVASCNAPSFSPTGELLVWSCYDRATGSALWMSDGMGFAPTKVLQDFGAKNFAWRSDGKALAFAAYHVVNRFNTWSDVYLLQGVGVDTAGQPKTLDADDVSTLTNGARARDPAFSPDGSRLYVVTNHAQQNQLEVLTVDKRLTPLTDLHDHEQFSTPEPSPDGHVIALSAWIDGRRDLWLYSNTGDPIRRLTADVATDRDVAWSPDGRYLYFSSDRSGIPNIYAIEIATERLWQVTNVYTGATNPTISPDGRWLAYVQYSHDGGDVRMVDLWDHFRPQATSGLDWLDRGVLPRPIDEDVPLSSLVTPVDAPLMPTTSASLWQGDPLDGNGPPAREAMKEAAGPGESVDTYEQSHVKDVFGEEQEYPWHIRPHRYDPFHTLLPSFWLPSLQVTPYPATRFPGLYPNGLYVSAYTGGVDTLHHASWFAQGTYRDDIDFLGGNAAITYNRFLPVFTVGGGVTAVPTSGVPLEDGWASREAFTYWQERASVYASVAYPYTYKTNVFLRYSLSNRTDLVRLPPNVDLSKVPVRGRIGTIEGGWRYSYGQPTSYAISPEDASVASVVGSLIAPWLGTSVIDEEGKTTGITKVELTGEVREYLVNPWIPNHVLALRLASGLTFGREGFLGNYELGGSYGDSAFYATPSELRMLRGYPVGADIGDLYWLAGAEYRFPVWRIDRGWGTIPLFLRYLSAAGFVDSGNAFTDPRTWHDVVDGTLVGVGGELRLSSAIGWSTGFDARLGYAVGLTDGGIPASAQAFYVRIGTPF